MAHLNKRQAIGSMPQVTQEYIALGEGPLSIRTMSAILALATVVVALRFWVRLYRRIRLGLEDWSMANS
ncbi:hypothetical protein F4779DRAFT_568674 [Xylariaceae sp. FL0662B]|nr:hypothetical protein F4779DRAFT_568674 [Xylariaceae sp. FL0662B]